MEIWIVLLSFSSGVLTEESYRQCLEQLDVSSQTRVKRFYRREDAWRSLTGMLLPRAFLREHGIPLESVTFSRTEAGKPFLDAPGLKQSVGYNISHDNHMVAMASHIGSKQDNNKVGIDVMKRALPKGETVGTFLRAIEDTLTKAELNNFTPEMDSATAIRSIFLLWTLKEAYTKALGLGLGFDFKRIEYNIAQSSVSIDGRPVQGWQFLFFVVQEQESADVYQGVVARWVGGEGSHMEFLSSVEEDPRFTMKGIPDLITRTR